MINNKRPYNNRNKSYNKNQKNTKKNKYYSKIKAIDVLGMWTKVSVLGVFALYIKNTFSTYKTLDYKFIDIFNINISSVLKDASIYFFSALLISIIYKSYMNKKHKKRINYIMSKKLKENLTISFGFALAAMITYSMINIKTIDFSFQFIKDLFSIVAVITTYMLVILSGFYGIYKGFSSIIEDDNGYRRHNNYNKGYKKNYNKNRNYNK